MVTTTPLCLGVSLVTVMIGELCIDIQSYLNDSLFSIVHMQSKGTAYNITIQWLLIIFKIMFYQLTNKPIHYF